MGTRCWLRYYILIFSLVLTVSVPAIICLFSLIAHINILLMGRAGLTARCVCGTSLLPTAIGPISALMTRTMTRRGTYTSNCGAHYTIYYICVHNIIIEYGQLQMQSRQLTEPRASDSPELLKVLHTKSTPVMALHFSRVNLLLCAGAFVAPDA